MRPKANPGTDGGGGDGRRRPRRTAWCASILLVVTTLVALNIVGVILRSAVERETTDQTYRRQMMARFYRGDPVRESGNQRETGNAIGVSGASTKVYHHLTTEPSHRRKRREKRAQASQFDSAKFDSAGDDNFTATIQMKPRRPKLQDGDGLWHDAIASLLWLPANAPVKCAPARIPACATESNRRLLVAMMFSFEVDTLHVALEQYRGIADVLLVESATVHNLKERQSKPLLWKNVLATRLKEYNVSAVTCTPRRSMKKQMWDAEQDQNACMSRAIQRRVHAYDVVIVGSVDEILGRDALMKLRYCSLPALPTSSAIGMPMGLLNRKFRTDWHYSGRPYSFSLPSIYPSSHKGPFVRSFHPLGPMPVIGGMHLTNYCFLPNIILKDLTGTSYAHEFTSKRLCTQSIAHWKRHCYYGFAHRLKRGEARETELPCALSTETYPAWNGSIDERERRFWDLHCKSHGSWVDERAEIVKNARNAVTHRVGSTTRVSGAWSNFQPPVDDDGDVRKWYVQSTKTATQHVSSAARATIRNNVHRRSRPADYDEDDEENGGVDGAFDSAKDEDYEEDYEEDED